MYINELAVRRESLKFMAAAENQSLLPEVIEKIALFLPLPDVAKCMRVCKQWKVRNNDIFVIYGLWFMVYGYSTGQDLHLPRGKGHRRTSKFHTKVPHLTHPPLHVRKTATALGSILGYELF